MRSIVLALCLAASPAFADIPSPRTNRVETTHRFRFVGTEDYPDYVFLFGFYSASGSNRGDPRSEPARVVVIKDGQPHAASGYRLGGDHLLAIPRAEFDARKNEFGQQGPFTLLTVTIPGTLKCDLRAAVRNEIAEYRVHLKDAKLTVELLSDPSIFTVPPTPDEPTPVAPTPLRTEGAASQQSSIMPWLFSAAACIALSMCLALGGIWLAWRYGRKVEG